MFNNRVYVISGQDSACELTDVWSSADGSNWTLESEDTGMPGRRQYSTAVYDGHLWLHGGYWSESIAHYQRDIWRTSDGENWRTGVKAEVPLVVK